MSHAQTHAQTQAGLGGDAGSPPATEALGLRKIGNLQITRASHVERDSEGYWWADMGPVDGPVLGPFRSRTEALHAERGWLTNYRQFRNGS